MERAVRVNLRRVESCDSVTAADDQNAPIRELRGGVLRAAGNESPVQRRNAAASGECLDLRDCAGSVLTSDDENSAVVEQRGGVTATLQPERTALLRCRGQRCNRRADEGQQCKRS